MINGIDVSGWDPALPNYSGCDFVIIKATEGVGPNGYVNPHMASQAAQARKLGLAVHFYHFLDAQLDPKAQMDWFTAKAVSIAGDGLWVDWEEDPAKGVWATPAQKDSALAELKALRGKNHKCGLYTNVDGWLHHDTSNNCGDGLWIADVSVPAGRPPIQHAWTIHQYAQSPDKDVANFATKAAMLEWMGFQTGPTVSTTVKALPVTPAPAPALSPAPEPEVQEPPAEKVTVVENATVLVQQPEPETAPTSSPATAPAPTVLRTYKVQVMSDGTLEVTDSEAPVPPAE